MIYTTILCACLGIGAAIKRISKKRDHRIGKVKETVNKVRLKEKQSEFQNLFLPQKVEV